MGQLNISYMAVGSNLLKCCWLQPGTLSLPPPRR